MVIFPRSVTGSVWRKRFLTVWVALTILLAGYVGIAAPFVTAFGADKFLIGVVVPPAMIVLLGLGFAWLLLFATGKPKDGASRSNDQPGK